MRHQNAEPQPEDQHKRYGSDKLLKGASQADRGRIRAQGRPAEMLTNPRTERPVQVFSGSPK